MVSISFAGPFQNLHSPMKTFLPSWRMTYEAAAYSLSDQTKVFATLFNCTLRGWVNRGVLTPAGRAIAQRPIKTNAFEILDLGAAHRRAT